VMTTAWDPSTLVTTNGWSIAARESRHPSTARSETSGKCRENTRPCIAEPLGADRAAALIGERREVSPGIEELDPLCRRLKVR
jgi:hypothetical protein